MPRFSLRRPRPLGAAFVVAAGATVAVAVLAAGPWGRSPAPSALATSPTCEHIEGFEYARDRRWRIVRVGADDDYDKRMPVVACRLHEQGPARVRVLGRSQGEDQDGGRGEDYLDVAGFASGRVVIETTTGGDEADVEFARTERGTYTLIDLDRGRATRLPGMYLSQQDAKGRSIAQIDVAVHMTPEGGLIWATTSAPGEAEPTHAAEFTRWDAAGVVPLPGVRELLDSQVAGSFYTRKANGTIGRIATQGAAVLPPGTTPSLAWRSMELPTATSAEEAEADSDPPGGHNIEPLGSDWGDGDGPWLEWSGRGSHDPASVVSIHWNVSDGHPLVTLAGHSQQSRRALRELGNGLRTALVSGRFAAHPNERRLRLISHNAAAVRFFDRPATASMEQAGHAAVDAGYTASSLRIALADGDRLLLWGRYGGSVRTVPGAHDLVAGQGGFFLTTGSGRATFIRD